jgi:hypothetical protein
MSGTVLALSSGANIKRDDAFDAFWRRFKYAVITEDKSAVAGLSRFPIGMSYGISSIKNKSDLKRRYKEVFKQQTDAANCFSNRKPVVDADNSKRFTIGCSDAAGNEVVIYEFELTKTGWKFVRLDNINE